MRKWVVPGLLILLVISLAVIWVISGDLRDSRSEARLEAPSEAPSEAPREAPREVPREVPLEPGPDRPSSLLDEFQIKALKKQGLSDPLTQIPADLMAHPELIPIKGVHGGTMGFTSAEGITVLSPSWVFARFEDGHMMGTCLLEYEISPDATIHWKLIKAQLDE
jgi:hypothetical protein